MVCRRLSPRSGPRALDGPWSGRQELRQPGQIAGCHGHRELRADPVEASVNSLGYAAHGFGPSEGFLDFPPAPLGQGIAGMLRGAPVDGRMTGLLRNMRGHDHPPEFGDEVATVVSLVRPERQAPGRARGAPIDHLKRRLPLAMPIHCPAGACAACCRKGAWVNSACPVALGQRRAGRDRRQIEGLHQVGMPGCLPPSQQNFQTTGCSNGSGAQGRRDSGSHRISEME